MESAQDDCYVSLDCVGVYELSSCQRIFSWCTRASLEGSRDIESSCDAIMGYKPHLAYLAKLHEVSIVGPDTIEKYLQRARERNVHYIVYSEFEEQYWKGLHALRDPALMPKEFRVVYEHIPTKTFVYEITHTPDSS